MTEKNHSKIILCLKDIKVLAEGLVCNETETFQGAEQKNPEKRFRLKAYFARRRFLEKTVRIEMRG